MAIFGLKWDGIVVGSMRDRWGRAPGNLLEKFLVLDSFCADLVLETRTAVDVPILGRFSFI